MSALEIFIVILWPIACFLIGMYLGNKTVPKQEIFVPDLIHWHPAGGFDHACGDQQGECHEIIKLAQNNVTCPICRKHLLEKFPLV